jgi:hypothetical protein
MVPAEACGAPALTAMTAAAGPPVEITVIEAEPDEALASVRDGRADVAQITPQPTRYIGPWLPRRHQPNPAAERLITALRTR